MSRRTPPPPPPSRRARRAAQRAARQQRREGARPGGPAGLPGSPLVWLTVAGVAVAAVIIGVLVLNSPSPAAAAVTAPAITSPPSLANGRTIGSAGAPVTIDVWADFQCPGCEAFTRLVQPKLVDNYVTPGKAKMVFHDMAFLGHESTEAAIAARCAEQQGKFWAYHDYLFANQRGENQGAFSRDRLIAIAGAAGLDQAAFTRCLDDTTVAQAVQAETQQGASQRITSTPTIFVNGAKQPDYNYATLSAAIDAALGVASPTPSGSSSAAASP